MTSQQKDTTPASTTGDPGSGKVPPPTNKGRASAA
jgi:hypothetical protein